MTRDTTSEAFFEGKYRADPDPWNFVSDSYELGRYETICRAVSDRRYRRAFEPGCSIGVLTARLASLCDRVEAIDISPSAARQARERCRDLPNVSIGAGALPGAVPEGSFDLIVLSEIGYYFDEKSLLDLGGQLASCLVPRGTLLAVHWLGTAEDHVISGDRVHELLRELTGLELSHSERTLGFRLDRWERW